MQGYGRLKGTQVFRSTDSNCPAALPHNAQVRAFSQAKQTTQDGRGKHANLLTGRRTSTCGIRCSAGIRPPFGATSAPLANPALSHCSASSDVTRAAPAMRLMMGRIFNKICLNAVAHGTLHARRCQGQKLFVSFVMFPCVSFFLSIYRSFVIC